MSLPANVSVLDAALNKIESVLSDPANGFNPQLQQTLTQPQYSSLTFTPIDFTTATGSYIRGKTLLDDILKSRPNMRWPFIQFWADRTRPAGNRKGFLKNSIFSGNVDMYLDFHFTYTQQTVQRDFELVINAYLNTLFVVLNSPTGPNRTILSTGPVYWNNSLSVLGKSEARIGGKGWTQSVNCFLSPIVQY